MASTILSDNGVTSGSAGLKTTAASDGALALQTTTAGGTATTALTIDTSQNVGIGQTPTYKLDVLGSTTRIYNDSAKLLLQRPSNSRSGSISITNANGGIQYYAGNNGSGENATIAHQFYSDAPSTLSPLMTILGGGNVGIGVTSPNKPLSVYGGDGYIQMLNASTGTATGDGAFIGVEGGTTALRIVNQENDVISFSTNGLANERMRIDTSGKLLVGTTTAGLKLTVQDGVTISSGDQSTCRLVLQNTTSPGRTFSLVAGTVGVGNDNFTIYDNTASATRLTINSSGYLQCLGVYNQTNPNAANVFVGSAGDLYRSTSSLKYKKNIENSVHGLTDLLKLRSVTYQSSNPDNGEQVFGGFIAEEVHDAGLTEFVQYAEDGSPDALAYGNMVALCVKSIQELKAINDTQAETINALTARIVALEQA
jgi:hypothetical protein